MDKYMNLLVGIATTLCIFTLIPMVVMLWVEVLSKYLGG